MKILLTELSGDSILVPNGQLRYLYRSNHMAKRSYSLNAKGRILAVAKKIFAKKGFDGSRVDEIAKAANVPKSLIYYHFKSKDAILEELLNNCLTDYENILKTVAADPLISRRDMLLERVHSVYLKFLQENEDVIRISSMEALKKNSNKAHLAFKFVERFMEIEEAHLKQNNRSLSPDARSARMVTEFFTSFIPVTLFSCFRDVWADYFQMDKETLSQQFLTAYNATYGAYRQQQ